MPPSLCSSEGPPHLTAASGLSLQVLAKFLRLTRIFRLMKLANHLASARLLRILMLVIALAFATHWLACAWALIAQFPSPTRELLATPGLQRELFERMSSGATASDANLCSGCILPSTLSAAPLVADAVQPFDAGLNSRLCGIVV